MPVVRLTDAFIHDVYMSYTAVDNPETTAFYQAGIIASNPVMNEIARAGGIQCTVPFWQDIDPDLEPNYSNDDPEDEATPNKIGSSTMTCRKAFVNQGFGEMNLVVELAGSSPMQHIRNRFGTYWQRQLQRRMLATARGVMAANVTENGGDMIVDISDEAGDAALFNSNVFIDAAYTAGSSAEMFTGIGVNSMVMARMLKNDEIVYLPDSSGALTIPTYKGRRVIVDDANMMVLGSGKFLSVLYGTGAIGFGGVEGHAVALGEGTPKIAAEVAFNARAGNGAGMEEIWERNTWIVHPFGYDWNELKGPDAITEFSPTLANLMEGKRWSRKVHRKQVPLAFIVSKA